MTPENQILGITLPGSPLGYDDKIFKCCSCEEKCSCPRQSYNEWLQIIRDISGVNDELLGKSEEDLNG